MSGSPHSSRSTLDSDDQCSSPSSTTQSLTSSLNTSIPTSSCSPCSPSILRNPLPPTSRGNKTVLISHHPSAPPAHWLAENPDHPIAKAAAASSPSSPPWADQALPHSRSSSANPPSERQRDAAQSPERKCTFAPLPPGRRAYRSNSLSIGVAARASMISGQGGGAPFGQQRAQYAGPQQWYQTGGVAPPDVYTYKDVQKGLHKLWGKVRRRNSSMSTSSAEAEEMEREGKNKSQVEHIEEAAEDDLTSDPEDMGFDDDDDHAVDDRLEEVRGRALGLTIHDSDESSVTSDNAPKTPPLDQMDGPFTAAQKGKGKMAPRATSVAVAL